MDICHWCRLPYLDYARHIGADCPVMNEAFGELVPAKRSRRSSSYITKAERREEGLQLRTRAALRTDARPSTRQRVG